MKNGLITRIKAAISGFRHPAGGTASSSWLGGFYNRLPGSTYDYERAAGDAWQNSIVSACCKWASRTFPEAPFVVEKKNGKSWEILEHHELSTLINRPNPFYSGRTLWAGTLLSLMVNGNSYWLKVRSLSGKVVELWYLPHFLVEPRWKSDGTEYISVYEYKSGGGSQWLDPADVIHFRDGIDPNNSRKGLSPLGAQLREICTDNEAATFSAAILRNGGASGVVIKPTDATFEMTPERALKIKKLYKENYGGENRGEALVLTFPADIENPGFSPAELSVDVMRKIPEERISAALGIPSMVVGLGSGLARATYSNYQEAREAAYEGFIIPTQRLVAGELDSQLLGEIDSSGKVRCAFDLSQVRVLQADQDKLWARVSNAYRAGVLKRKEAKGQIGLEYDETLDDVYCTDLTKNSGVDVPAGGLQ